MLKGQPNSLARPGARGNLLPRLFPSCFSSNAGNLASLFWIELLCPRFATSSATLTSTSDLWSVFRQFLNLASRYVSDQLCQREWIAGAFLATFRHAFIIAQADRGRTAISRRSDFKLTHYQALNLPGMFAVVTGSRQCSMRSIHGVSRAKSTSSVLTTPARWGK